MSVCGGEVGGLGRRRQARFGQRRHHATCSGFSARTVQATCFGLTSMSSASKPSGCRRQQGTDVTPVNKSSRLVSATAWACGEAYAS